MYRLEGHSSAIARLIRAYLHAARLNKGRSEQNGKMKPANLPEQIARDTQMHVVTLTVTAALNASAKHLNHSN